MNQVIDKVYCSSSFLMYRTIADHNKIFSASYIPHYYSGRIYEDLDSIHNSNELEKSLCKTVAEICKNKKTALALSGGIDSAILARFMPRGSKAYTFKCIVPGVNVIDESKKAAQYATECGIQHEVIEIYWEDFGRFAPILMKHKGAPCHSIEVQIYKACLTAIDEGFEAIIFGESADLNYGGLSGLLSKDWTIGEFIDRYSYVKPYKVLKKFELITTPIVKYAKNGFVDVHEFDRGFFLEEAMGSYTNACETAGIGLCCPYERTYLSAPLDVERIRKGENKYIIRELFSKLYPSFSAPPKTPMPRPMDEWFRDWKGPTRPEFWPNCIKNMNGDQKYYVWALEKFLDLLS